LSALQAEGYSSPTPIQAGAIPSVLSGRDLLGIAQTGTGKTAAFALPILERLAAGKRPHVMKGRARALILSPTRELASQIAESFRVYGKNMRLSVAVIFGGVPMGSQRRALAPGVDILVATPGRLIDHLEQGFVSLDAVDILVLDEADRMLDMGFIAPIRRLIRAMAGRPRQNLFFSATMPRDIAVLASELLNDPFKVEVTPAATTVERITQRVIHIDETEKRHALTRLVQTEAKGLTLVFTRTKHRADRVVRHLEESGIYSAALHGNKSQSQRERALDGFRRGAIRVLVATDIAARGIDVDGITHVINYDLPNVAESYVHRIGRTARAGNDGAAISFCAREERPYLRDIEKVTRQTIPAEGAIPAQGRDRGPAGPPPSPALREGQRDGQRDGHREPRREGARPHANGNHSHGAKPGRTDHGKPAHGDGRPAGQPGNRQRNRRRGKSPQQAGGTRTISRHAG